MPNPALASPPVPGPGVSGVWEVAAGLAVVVIVILAIGWFARRLHPGVMSGNRALKVVATLPVGPRERLLLLDASGQHLLLGITAQQITALHHFAEPVVLPESASPGDFALRLKEALGRGGQS